MSKLPAVLGGSPIFASPIEVARPSLPDIELTTARIETVLRSRRLSNNSATVQQLERDLAEWLGVRNAVAMCNGTLTLILTLKALGLRGRVVVPSFTFCATVHAVVWAGLEPVFAEIDPSTFNITPATVESVLTEDVSALMPVHVYGSPCDIGGFEDLAARHGLALAFDSAQAIGSTYAGRKLGGYGDVESFSIHATKLLPTGEGGIVTTDDDDLANRLRQARNFGLDDDSDCTMIGINAKMCEFPAVLGTLGLPNLDEAIRRRGELVDHYRRHLGKLTGLRFQKHLADSEPNHQNLVVLIDEHQFGLSRDHLMEALKVENILCRRYFHPPVHLTSAYAGRIPAKLPVTESVAQRCLCLPLFSDMPAQNVEMISSAIISIQERSHEVRTALGGRQEPVHQVFSSPVPAIRKRTLSIALPSRPKGLYDEMGVMLLDVLSDSEYDASLVGDGDRNSLDADLLLMIGDCLEFEGYAALFGGLRTRRPITALWLLDTLPPAPLNNKAAKIGNRLGLYNQGLRLARSHLQPIRNLIPLSLRRRIGLSACSFLLHGITDEMTEESQLEIRKLDVNSQYEVFGRYEWINRNHPKGWIDRIFVNTVPKQEFLTGVGVPATFMPLGFHPNMGRNLGIGRDIDVLFIGELDYGRRKAAIEYLQQELDKRGRSVTVIGSGCYGEERVEMMNRAKISLNIPRFPWDIPTIRVFLSIGCGSLVVSEEMGDSAPFESGRHLVQAGAPDLGDVICHYLEHDDERLAIVGAAFDLIYGDLTLSKSVFRLLDSMKGEQRLAA